MPIPLGSLVAVVGILLLLAPGFLFWAGYASRARYSPEVAPKSTLGLLAFAAVFSVSLHLLAFPVYFKLAGMVGPGNPPAADDLPQVTISAETLADLKRFLAVVARNSSELFLYLLVTSSLGFFTGFGLAWSITKRFKFTRALVKHDWAYQHLQRDKITVAHVLSNAGPEAAQVLYDGELVGFGLSDHAPGQLTYLCLRKVRKGVLRITPEGTSTVDIRQLDPVPGADSIFLIKGDAISNVVFSTMQVKPALADQLLSLGSADWKRLYEIAAAKMYGTRP